VTLNDLALKYGTDKSSADHNYCPLYEQHLPIRGAVFSLLELGVWHGASLRMWREYFPNATIVGVDNRDRHIKIDGVSIHIMGQDDHEDIEFCLAPYDGFDVIIDDASHISSKTIGSFQNLWNHLKPNGIYVIEDLQTSYDVEHYGENEAHANPNVPAHYSHTAMEWCKRLADEVNHSLFPAKHRLGWEVASVQFFPNICFITKEG
jgi:hypothetical protein